MTAGPDTGAAAAGVTDTEGVVREEGGKVDIWGGERELTVAVVGWNCWAKLKDDGIVGWAERVGGVEVGDRGAGRGGRQVWLSPGGPETGAHFL